MLLITNHCGIILQIRIKGFIVRQLLKYTILETDRSMVDLLYRNLFDKYKNY